MFEVGILTFDAGKLAFDAGKLTFIFWARTCVAHAPLLGKLILEASIFTASCSASSVVSSFTMALLPIFFARCAKRSVLCVSAMLRVLGEMLAIITVLELPPREFCKKFVHDDGIC